MHAYISQGNEYKSWGIMFQQYRSLVRAHLEYCMQFWSPSYRKNIIKMERVQMSFARLLLVLEGLSYKWLDRLGYFSLESRRLKGDFIEVYKIMRSINNVDGHSLFLG